MALSVFYHYRHFWSPPQSFSATAIFLHTPSRGRVLLPAFSFLVCLGAITMPGQLDQSSQKFCHVYSLLGGTASSSMDFSHLGADTPGFSCLIPFRIPRDSCSPASEVISKPRATYTLLPLMSFPLLSGFPGQCDWWLLLAHVMCS